MPRFRAAGGRRGSHAILLGHAYPVGHITHVVLDMRGASTSSHCTRGFCASKSCISTRPFKLRATPPLQPLPPLPQCKHFVNLTNGVEALPMLQDLGLSFRCAAANFVSCAVPGPPGPSTLVYDAGSRIPEWGVPRAVWQGLTFARWALTRLWLGPEAATVCGALCPDCRPQHHRHFRDASRQLQRKYQETPQVGKCV
ncbi:magnesium chelatase [Haematococcus lacustris]|uniref:Magnesium chelatase n=1 Tax=Haematococcus lacustris TaxID=44745 RepID=A0A699ZYQ0_HAELA|nr:magnesium chelatase [Haematococcus lacustris]